MDTTFKASPIILGTRSEAGNENSGALSSLPYGYRRLDPAMAFEIFRGLEQPDEEPQRKTQTNKLLAMLSSLETVAPEPGGSYAQGPFVFAPHGAITLSEPQKTVEERLTAELQRLLRNRYPSYQ